MNKIILGIAVALIWLIGFPTVYALHYQSYQIRNEDYYNTIFCKEVKGQREAVLKDGTRCDCLERNYSFEADFATKFYEAIGQSLHYARITGKKPGIFLIVKRKTDEDMLQRCIDNCIYYKIELRYIKLYDRPDMVHILPQKIDGDGNTN